MATAANPLCRCFSRASVMRLRRGRVQVGNLNSREAPALADCAAGRMARWAFLLLLLLVLLVGLGGLVGSGLAALLVVVLVVVVIMVVVVFAVSSALVVRLVLRLFREDEMPRVAVADACVPVLHTDSIVGAHALHTRVLAP